MPIVALIETLFWYLQFVIVKLCQRPYCSNVRIFPILKMIPHSKDQKAKSAEDCVSWALDGKLLLYLMEPWEVPLSETSNSEHWMLKLTYWQQFCRKSFLGFSQAWTELTWPKDAVISQIWLLRCKCNQCHKCHKGKLSNTWTLQDYLMISLSGCKMSKTLKIWQFGQSDLLLFGKCQKPSTVYVRLPQR